MRVRLRSFACFAAILTACVVSASETSVAQDLSPARRITLRGFQQSEVSTDLPANDIILDTDNGLWIAGRKAIWRWSLITSQMQKLALVENASDSLQSLGAQGSSLLAASNRWLFRVNFNPAKVLRFAHPVQGTGRSLGFNLTDGMPQWLHQDGILVLESSGAKMMTSHVAPLINAERASIHDGKSEFIWFTRGRYLAKMDLKDPKSKVQLVHKATSNFEDVQSTQESIFARTQQAVLRFSPDGKLIQAIPAQGQRRIVAMHITQQAHYYLFHDGLLERYDIARKKVNSFAIPIKPGQHVGKLIGRNAIIAVLIDGLPNAYFLHDIDV